MSRASSKDLRERVIGAVAAGASARPAAARFGFGIVTAVRRVRRWRDTGERTARRQGSPKRSVVDAHEAFLLGLLDGQVVITLDEMRARLEEEGGLRAARTTIRRFFAPARAHDEKQTGHASGQERTDIAAARLAWFAGQPDLDPERLIFIDETWLNTKMARRRGHAPRGEPLRAQPVARPPAHDHLCRQAAARRHRITPLLPGQGFRPRKALSSNAPICGS